MDTAEILLARIDERTKDMKEDLAEVKACLAENSTILIKHEERICKAETDIKDNRALIVWLGSGVIVVAGGTVMAVLRHMGIL